MSIETENETKTNWVTRKRKKNPFPFGYVTRIELKRARSDQPGKEEKKNGKKWRTKETRCIKYTLMEEPSGSPPAAKTKENPKGTLLL